MELEEHLELLEGMIRDNQRRIEKLEKHLGTAQPSDGEQAQRRREAIQKIANDPRVQKFMSELRKAASQNGTPPAISPLQS
jgi:predicted RNase H-like nuclease (RuvC/YqgF family)